MHTPIEARQVALRSRLSSRPISEGVFKILADDIDRVLGMVVYLSALTVTVRCYQPQMSLADIRRCGHGSAVKVECRSPIVEPLIATAGIMLIVLSLLIVTASFSAIVGLGLSAFTLIVVMTCAALAAGHVLGGPDPNDRTTLALACATRFPALGLLIASRNFPNARPLPPVVAYVLTSTLTAVPYIRWRKTRQRAHHVGKSPLAA